MRVDSDARVSGGKKENRPEVFDNLKPISVSKMRLELTRPNGHYPLKVAASTNSATWTR